MLDNVNQLLFDKIFNSKIEEEIRGGGFRASKMPVCGIEYCLFQLTSDKDKPAAITNFAKDFYCSVGTIVHSAYQKHLANMGELFGIHKCPSCGKEILGWKSFFCKKCKKLSVYQEFQLFHYPNFSGHVDGFLRYDDGLLLGDFKTTSLQGITHYNSDKDLPLNYKMQTNAYWKIAENLGFPVKAAAIIYIPRDNPKKGKIISVKKNEKFFTDTINICNEAKNAVDTGSFKKMCRLCETKKEAENCDWGKVCFGYNSDEELRKHFKTLWKKKHD